MKYILLSVLCLISCTSEGKWITFSKTVLPPIETNQCSAQLNDQLVNTLQEQKINKPALSPYSLFSYTTMNKLINAAALLYASYKIYKRYLEMGKPVPETFMYKMIGYIRPIPLQTITTQGSFFIDSAGIIVETLLYKTLAQLIVVCATSDVLDLIESAVSRSKRIVKALLI